jgi:hypothetical protein
MIPVEGVAMHLISTVAVVAIVVAGSGSALAQPAAGIQPSPYGSLFGKPPKVSAPSPLRFTVMPRLSTILQGAAKPAVVCGMTLLPGDSKIDLGFQRLVLPGSPAFTIRKVQPTTCR